ncbi:MAG: hypothetical protein KC766_11735 [Myxococcales bacterium]|nr:hypothetical protein [Myxococcales bacterium]
MPNASSHLAALCALAVGVFAGSGCSREPSTTRAESPPAASSSRLAEAKPRAPELPSKGPGERGEVPKAEAPPEPDLKPYPWLVEHPELSVQDDLQARVPAPEGTSRVSLPEHGFGAWLRHLPMLPHGTPVRSHAGGRLRDGESSMVTGVVALDIGQADLQQCADAVMRLHGEWLWSQGGRDQAYRAASGMLLDYRRWSQGQRIVAKGASIGWAATGRPRDDHPTFRRFMDAVFAWSNTVALARMGKHVSYQDLRPGDFLIEAGNPGHTVLVLDMVRAPDGSQRVLLGQSYMPAQSFHVLKSPEGPWFRVSAERGVKTPFWPRAFEWAQLRRLDT